MAEPLAKPADAKAVMGAVFTRHDIRLAERWPRGELGVALPPCSHATRRRFGGRNENSYAVLAWKKSDKSDKSQS